jgi:protein SCO1/2
MRRAAVALLLIALAPAAWAHDGVVHATPEEAAAHAAATAQGLPLPLNLGGPFRLTDQHGVERTEADPQGHMQILFFGYASCQEICSAALPQMADVAAGLAARGVPVTPVMITVDPVRDTLPAMKASLAKFGPGFLGLTGDRAALQAAYDLFQIETVKVFDDPASGPVYAHGSFLYLLDGQGKFLTVIPPILPDDRVIDMIAAYAPAG